MTDSTMTSPTEQAAIPRRRARMGYYALWQMRDYALERGLASMMLAALFLIPGALMVRATIAAYAEGHATVRPSAVLRYGSLAAAQHVHLHDASLDAIGMAMGNIVFLSALLAIQGLASNDRKNGYFRFLFSKPVSPARYYGQAFVVHLVGFLLAVVVLAALWAAFVFPVGSLSMLLAMGLVYLCYSGILFLLTAATRWDWIVLVVVTLASTTLWTKYGDSTSPLAKLLWLLPPLTKTESVYQAAVAQTALPWGTAAWLAGYGLVCYVAGLVVLHHRRLAIP